MLPLDSLFTEHRELGLVIAVAIGFGFGFVLERAGFGRATKLAAQFYLHDMTVFKVMFAAIITAMAGVWVADGVGLIEFRALAESAVSFTYLWPMLVGGLVLGAGFIISGYCPGTSVVATASGNLDGLVTFVGVIIGSVIYGELFPLIASFHTSGDQGFLFLPDVIGIPAPVLAAVIVAAAIGMFLGAEKVERIFKRRRGELPEGDPSPQRPRIFALSAIGGLALLALITLGVPQTPRADEPRTAVLISQDELARRIIDEPWTLRIIDLRDAASCAEARIPGTQCAPRRTISTLGLPYDTGTRDLVLVDETTATAPDEALAYKGRLFTLEGGWSGWRAFALVKPLLPEPGASSAEQEYYTFRAALHSALSGQKPAPLPPANTTYVPRKKKKKGGGCS